MAVFGQKKKPQSVAEGLGLDTTGGIVSAAPPASPMAQAVSGGMMGSLTEMAMERRKMGGSMQSDQSTLFTDEKKKRMKNGITDATSGFGPA